MLYCWLIVCQYFEWPHWLLLQGKGVKAICSWSSWSLKMKTVWYFDVCITHIRCSRKDQQYTLVVQLIYSVYWLLHVSAVACHHQGAKLFHVQYPTISTTVTLHTYLPMKMEQCSEMLAFKLDTGNNPEESIWRRILCWLYTRFVSQNWQWWCQLNGWAAQIWWSFTGLWIVHYELYWLVIISLPVCHVAISILIHISNLLCATLNQFVYQAWCVIQFFCFLSSLLVWLVYI
jgi:hypothetical protein